MKTKNVSHLVWGHTDGKRFGDKIYATKREAVVDLAKPTLNAERARQRGYRVCRLKVETVK